MPASRTGSRRSFARRALRAGSVLLVMGALAAGLAACGDSRDCAGGGCTAQLEVCGTAGDEDGNGVADCADPACDIHPGCAGCGDGIHNVGEACDDGNADDTDGCTQGCQRARCGDGLVQAGIEDCDDGNVADEDACTGLCTIARCGDGLLQPEDEACDDGNQDDTDACTVVCEPARCGDGFVQVGEACDDGNGLNDDACLDTCRVARCGDGWLRPGFEQCDDGDMANDDECIDTCRFAVCGDGFVRPLVEDCDDGNGSNDDACVACRAARCGDGAVQAGVEACDDGNALIGDACLPGCIPATCGDTAIHFGVEACDDGNQADDDACTSACAAARCGDGLLGAGEGCDDGNAIDGDGCEATCRWSGCGDGVVAGGEGCDDGNLVDGDGCDATCTFTGCGNRIVTAGEQCDDGNLDAGDGCTPACQRDCGDGVVAGAEACDDGNPINGDGCGPTCLLDRVETEPNGVVADADARGPFLVSAGDTAVTGAIAPIGDVDMFAVVNDTIHPHELRLDVWDPAPGFGAGVPCDDDLRARLRLFTASGWLADRTDRGTGWLDRCPGLAAVIPAGATVYAMLTEVNDAAVIPGYLMTIAFTRLTCGDGRLLPDLEECDDGNQVPGDGCAIDCTIEGIAEVEPNDDGMPEPDPFLPVCQLSCPILPPFYGNDFDATGIAVVNAIAQGVVDLATDDRTWLAVLDPLGDEDVFAVTNGGALPVEVGLVVAARHIGQAPWTDRDTFTVVIRAASGEVLPYASPERVFMLEPGQTRYVHASRWWNGLANPQAYALTLTGRPMVCGDGHQTRAREECDDGNALAGDGCSPICTVEGMAELEPNEDGSPSIGSVGFGNDFDPDGVAAAHAIIQGIVDVAHGGRTWRAALSPAGDEDVYAVTNSGPDPVSIRADYRDLTVGVARPCDYWTNRSPSMSLRDAGGISHLRSAGMECASLTFILLPGQVRFLHVVHFSDSTIVPSYALLLDATRLQCGDGTLGPGEECEDGGVIANDGCSATCEREATRTEVEPNGTFAEADAAPPALQLTGDTWIRGSLSSATDVDLFQLTLASPTVIRFETFAPTHGDCDTSATRLTLFDGAGATLVADLGSASGILECSALVVPLAAGTYYLQVHQTSGVGPVDKYTLEIATQTARGTEQEAEGTDGGNDTVRRAETLLTAGSDVYAIGDVHTYATDVWAITVPPGGRVRAEVVEADRSLRTCEDGWTGGLRLIDQTRTVRAEGRNSRQLCKLIDGTGTLPADPGARNPTQVAQTYYLEVRYPGSGPPAHFRYALQVTIR